MDRQKIEKGVQLILEGIGEDVQREGIRETPQRVARMCEEIFAGLHQQPAIEAGFAQDLEPNHIIALQNLSFFSMCEHHLLPFFGEAHIYYIPQNNRVAGFSSIARIVDIFARRLQLQERLTRQIADAIMESLSPQGVVVIVEALQLCLSMRGAKKESARTVTRAIRGSIDLQEVLSLHAMKK